MAETQELDNVATLESESRPTRANNPDAPKTKITIEHAGKQITPTHVLSLDELKALPSFEKLKGEQVLMLLEFRRCGDKLQAAATVHHLDLNDPEQRSKARLLAHQFERGVLSDAVSDLLGYSLEERVKDAIDRAIRSKNLTVSRVRALEELARVAGLIDAGKGAKSAPAEV